MPTLRILNPVDNMKKFQWEAGKADGVTVEALSQWIQDFKDGKLTAFLKSEPVPEKNDDPVKVIVGKTFESEVLDQSKDVFVKFYAPWCGHCKSLAPTWEAVASSLSDVNDLVIAKFDATANEADGVDIRGYPTLKFYPKGSNTPLDFDGDRTEEGIKTWLKEKSAAYKSYLETKGEL